MSDKGLAAPFHGLPLGSKLLSVPGVGKDFNSGVDASFGINGDFGFQELFDHATGLQDVDLNAKDAFIEGTLDAKVGSTESGTKDVFIVGEMDAKVGSIESGPMESELRARD
eukprot:6489658-Amphidinium_carterae.1